jgi:hypothetical protein
MKFILLALAFVHVAIAQTQSGSEPVAGTPVSMPENDDDGPPNCVATCFNGCAEKMMNYTNSTDMGTGTGTGTDTGTGTGTDTGTRRLQTEGTSGNESDEMEMTAEMTAALCDCIQTDCESSYENVCDNNEKYIVDWYVREGLKCSWAQPVKVYCTEGMYVKDKHSDHERCEMCQPGKYSTKNTPRIKKCKKCPKNSYQPSSGKNWCIKCPKGFRTRGQRGKAQCFQKGRRSESLSMKQLGMLPRKDGTYRVKPSNKDKADMVKAEQEDMMGEDMNGGTTGGTDSGSDTGTGTTE